MTTASSSTSAPEADTFPCPNSQTEYRATGFIVGRYIPNKQLKHGTIVTPEGELIPAKLTTEIANLFKQNPQFYLSEHSYLWSVWVRTDKEGKVVLTLKHFLTPPNVDETRIEKLKVNNNLFSIRGTLHCWSEEFLKIQINRNEKAPADIKPEWKWLYSPFKIKIIGSVPQKPRKGQFWEVFCERQGEMLVLKEATLIKEMPKKNKPELSRKRKNNSSTPVEPPAKPVRRFPVKPLSDHRQQATNKQATNKQATNKREKPISSPALKRPTRRS